MNKNKRLITLFFVFALLVFNLNIYFAAETGETREGAQTVSKSEEDIIIPVLMYHNIADEYPKGSEGANISPKLFEEHMVEILNRGYTPILVKDYYDCVQRGREIAENPIIITFDDGYLSNYEIAFPILKKLNIPATIFIVTSTVGLKAGSGVSTSHFTWQQAKEMQESGLIDIHSHSHTHRDMTTLSPAQLQEEIRISRYLIERNLGKNCYVFSYPFGRYNETTSRLVRYAGYRMQILVNYAESGQDYLANNIKNGIEHFTRLTVSGDMSSDDLFDMVNTAVENTKKIK